MTTKFKKRLSANQFEFEGIFKLVGVSSIFCLILIKTSLLVATCLVALPTVGYVMIDLGNRMRNQKRGDRLTVFGAALITVWLVIFLMPSLFSVILTIEQSMFN